MDIGIKQIILKAKFHERNSVFEIKKKTGINSFDLDILLFAKFNDFISVYTTRQHFSHTNVQQVRRSINKLRFQGHLELVCYGLKNKPALYWINKQGDSLLNDYLKLIIKEIE